MLGFKYIVEYKYKNDEEIIKVHLQLKEDVKKYIEMSHDKDIEYMEIYEIKPYNQ